MSEAIIIGVAGGTASGKTTVSARIKKEFADSVEILNHDCYYRAHHEMPFEERTKINYDHPNAFDTERFISDIKKLKEGKPIYRPVYSYSEHDRTEEEVLVCPAKVIVIDGILIFENQELRDLMDIKIFVDTDADERLMRRILRDVKERGRTLESVLTQYAETVKPMHEQFVEPTKRYADVIVPRGGQNDVALTLIMNRIRSIISEE